MQPIFKAYDTDESGAVDYKEFATAIFGAEGAAKASIKRNERVEPKT